MLSVCQTYSVVRFLWHYAIPVVVFVYCYGRIFHTIRRQSKVVAGHGQAASTAATSRGHQNTGQLQQQATEATTVAKLSHTELNVIKTMITVTVIFMIFWCATAFNNLLSPLGVSVNIVYHARYNYQQNNYIIIIAIITYSYNLLWRCSTRAQQRGTSELVITVK